MMAQLGVLDYPFIILALVVTAASAVYGWYTGRREIAKQLARLSRKVEEQRSKKRYWKEEYKALRKHKKEKQ